VRPLGRFVPDLRPPRWLGDAPRVEVPDRVRDSPDRARSFWTVRAAISRARVGDAPRWRVLFSMCSY